MTSSTRLFNLPTVDQLNELGTSDVMLLMARCLQTSDLSWCHSMYKPATLQDIVQVTNDIVNIDRDYITDNWSASEVLELNMACQDFLNDAKNRKDE